MLISLCLESPGSLVGTSSLLAVTQTSCSTPSLWLVSLLFTMFSQGLEFIYIKENYV